MAEGQTYNIPETQYVWFKDKIEKLNKKSLRLVGEKVFCTVIGYHFMDGEGHRNLQQMKIYEVFVAHPDVKLNGWQFVARIDHSQDMGNVVRTVPGQTLPERYRTNGPICEHCKERRPRRDTFVCHSEERGEYKQVGSACLKDFTGHNGAEKWARVAELLAIIGDCARGIGFSRDGGMNDYRWTNKRWYMALVADVVKTHGWVSIAKAKEMGWCSTRSRVDAALQDQTHEVSDESYDVADAAIEWAQDFINSGSEMSDWQHNAYVIAQSEALEFRHYGIAASIVGVYWNNFLRPKSAPRISNYVGTENQRLEIDVTVKGIFVGERSCRHVFEDLHGNVLLWFGSKSLGHDKVNSNVRIAAFVKKHQTYNEKKQTLISHVKVVG